jgi:hypothetical protein
MTYFMQLGVDPKEAPTPDGTVSDYAELSIAPWFGLPLCHPNFAYVQRNGVPTGPPSPQLANEFTLAPNAQTLLMNQGDSLRVKLEDTPAGFKMTVDDLTTGRSGFMVASAANGFTNTNIADRPRRRGRIRRARP